jgi:hypothetical protein
MSRTYQPVYRKSRAFDRTCRNHGKCGWCYKNRTYSNRKRLAAARYDLEEARAMKFSVHIDETVEVEADNHADAVRRGAWLILDDVLAGTRKPEVMTLAAKTRLYFAKLAGEGKPA